MARPSTPIERYAVNGRTIHVKRDDLFGRPPAPPLAKLRGIETVLEQKVAEGCRRFGCFETSVSSVGHALAAAVSQVPGVDCIVGYPQAGRKPTPASVLAAVELGATAYPVRSNFVAICYAQVKNHVESLGGYMLPFGFECQEAVEAVEREACTTSLELVNGGTVVVCCGSGVTLAGLIHAFEDRPARYLGISSGRSLAKITACLDRQGAHHRERIELVAATMPYSKSPSIDCPFPSHPNYDLKAWQYLTGNLASIADPILFWNVGA